MTTPPDAVQMPPLPDEYEAAAHMFLSALAFFKTGEKTDIAYSIPVGSPDEGESVPLWTSDQMQAHAAQRCAALEARLAVADARVAASATVIYEHLQLINDAANTLSQNGWHVTADALFTSSKAIEAAKKEHQ